jgi:hypothetical protein
VETRALNQSVKRNAERFPEDFIFQLTAGEFSALKDAGKVSGDGRAALRSQIVILAGLPLFDPDFNNFQYFGFYKWRVCKGYLTRRRSKGLVVQTHPVSIGGVLCIIMSHHVSQTFIPS